MAVPTPTQAVAILLIAELFESGWQCAPTLGGVLDRVEDYYRRHPVLLFAMHPSLWWVLYLYVARGFHGALLGAIVVMKGTDLLFKLWLIQRRREGRSDPWEPMLRMPLEGWMPWLNLLLYPPLLMMALS